MDSAEVGTRPETLDELVTRIEQQHASLPRRLREIGTFVLGHPEAIALSTLAELAAETDIATSAFVRFAQTLGFDGFSQMQSVFRQQVRNSWPQYGSRLSKIADVDPADHLEALSLSAVDLITRLSSTVSMTDLKVASQRLAQAETVWLAAGGRAKPVIVYMGYLLTQLGIRSQQLREAPAEAMRELNLTGPNDILLVVSFSPYGELTVNLAQRAHERGHSGCQHHGHPRQPGGAGYDPAGDRGEFLRLPLALRDDEPCPVSCHRSRPETRQGYQKWLNRSWT